MQLFYEDTDITDYVDVKSCIHRDVSGGRADGLEMVLEHAEKWFAWKPQRDDRIVVAHNGYTTGTLYLSMILPEDGKYRLTAASMPSHAKRKVWRCYEDTTIQGMMRACAAECGIG